MNRPTPRDVQVFVAGALAVMGFKALIAIPHCVSNRMLVEVIASLVGGMGLPIGISLLFGYNRALQIAKIYMWISAIGSLGMICVYLLTILNVVPAKVLSVQWYTTIIGLAKSLILLWLLGWRKGGGS